MGISPERIRPNGVYAVRARITDGDRSITTPAPVPVRTQVHASQDVRVRVRGGG